MLKKRLESIAKEVPAGARVVDVGTDHGYLPVFLWQRGDTKSIIASDINPAPLETARANIAAARADIATRLCDGLSGIGSDEADTVIIAGMGGDTIAEILSACGWIKDKDKLLLLQPMSSADSLRRFLYAEGFSILRERCVKDSGRIYTVMTARYRGLPFTPSPFDCFTGGLSKDPEALEREYLSRLLCSLIKKRRSIEDSPRMAEVLAETDEVIAKLKTVLGE